jgi:hypothetical protein
MKRSNQRASARVNESALVSQVTLSDELAAQTAELEGEALSSLISFFKVLDRWDRDAQQQQAEIM